MPVDMLDRSLLPPGRAIHHRPTCRLEACACKTNGFNTPRTEDFTTQNTSIALRTHNPTGALQNLNIRTILRTSSRFTTQMLAMLRLLILMDSLLVAPLARHSRLNLQLIKAIALVSQLLLKPDLALLRLLRRLADLLTLDLAPHRLLLLLDLPEDLLLPVTKLTPRLWDLTALAQFRPLKEYPDIKAPIKLFTSTQYDS